MLTQELLDVLSSMTCKVCGETARVVLSAERVIAPAEQMAILRALERTLPAGLSPHLQVKYPTLWSDFCREPRGFLPLLVRAMQEDSPGIATLLTSADLRVEGDVLWVVLPAMAVSFLTDRGGIPAVQRCVATLFGEKMAVQATAEVAADLPPPPAPVEEMFADMPDLPDDEPPPPPEPAPAPIAPPPPPEKEKPAYRPADPKIEGELMFGKPPRGVVVPIESLDAATGRCAVVGQVQAVELKTLRNPRNKDIDTLMTFDIQDDSGAIAAKAFVPAAAAQAIAQAAGSGLWLAVAGTAMVDPYLRELCIDASGAVRANAPQGRRDDAGIPRVELHLHTMMSAQDAMIPADKLIAQVAALGHDAVAVTDHGVLQAFPAVYESAKKSNVKVIFGMEGYLQDDHDPKKTYHIILLVKNQTGMNHLYRIVTASHLEYFHRRPTIPRALLQELREGLIIGSACEAGELYTAALEGAADQTLRDMAQFYDYVEIQPNGNNAFLVRGGKVKGVEGLNAINLRLCDAALAAGRPVVATGDVHFFEPQDALYRQVLHAAMGFDDAAEQAPLYMRTTREMLDEFAYLPADLVRAAVVDNPRAIAESIEKVIPYPDKIVAPDIKASDEELSRDCWAECHARYGDVLPEIVEKRLDRELKAIIGNHFGTLYWIAQKLVQRSHADGYVVGSRGSVGSSFVATMAGISEVNPMEPHYRCPKCRFSDFDVDAATYTTGADLPPRDCPECGEPLLREGYDIPFEVFMGFNGEKIPDIDLNFSGENQASMHAYCKELLENLGGQVFKAGTISAFAEQTAMGFLAKYVEKTGIAYLSAANRRRLSRGIMGIKRSTGQHPGGMVVWPPGVDVFDYTPLQYPADDKTKGSITTHFAFAGQFKELLVKVDILGHDYPTLLNKMTALTGVEEVPECHPEVVSLYHSCAPLGVTPEQIGTKLGTLALPEFGTPFARGILEQTQPKTMDELIRIMGLFHGTAVWLGNAKDLIESGTATLKTAVCNRDDILKYLGGKMEALQAFDIMESVRKGKGLVLKGKGDMEPVMREAGVPEWYIDSCKKIEYMFPKAHAAAYTIMANRMAFFKLYHPAAFYATWFSVRGDFDYFPASLPLPELTAHLAALERAANDKTITERDRSVGVVLEVVRECKARGINLLPVDIFRSQAAEFIIEGNALRPPFTALPGLGPTAAVSLVAARAGGPFLSQEDMATRAKLSKTVMELLRKSGALDDLPERAQLSLF